MKIWKRVMGALVVSLVVCVVCPVQVTATNINGRASTVFEWFDDPDENTATPIYQYLHFNATDIGDSGWNFRGYGRLADDLSDEVDVDSRLYFAYIEKRDLVDDLDFKLGRQFLSTVAGAILMDGLHLEYSGLGPVEIELFGGGDVSYYEGYNAEDLVFGVEIASNKLLKNLEVGLSYMQKWEDSDLSHELIGFDMEYDVPRLIQFYNETQYSWITDEVTYFLLGSKYYRSPNWSLTAEYLYSLPIFSANSIYSVFSVDEYEEASLEFLYTFSRDLRAFLRYQREFYESVSDADVFEAGIEKIRSDRFSGYLIGTYRLDDDGQDLAGVKARIAYRCTSNIETGIGAHVDVFERQIGFLGDQYNDDDETTSQRYWVDLTANITKSINLQAKLESVKSDLWDEYYRGRLRLNILF
ncbi:MAG: hypothetical protein C0616_12440 [Desulfuromonas sp.]|nr:MAG: hypothetical protein C0616_12440 [Desulfuromonas sp.]